MKRAMILALACAAALVGCTGDPAVKSPVLWHEGEDYAAGPRNETEGIGPKAPASGGEALYGAVLGAAGGFVSYEVKLDEPIPDARLLVRYARYHWREMDPAKIQVRFAKVDKTVIERTATFADTKGWGSKNKKDWSIAAVEVGPMAKGKWTITFAAPDEIGSDVNIDGFFLVPGDIEIAAEEMAAADRIHVNNDRFVGVGVPTAILFQQNIDALELPVRAFRPLRLDVKATILDERGAEAAVLTDVRKSPFDEEARTMLVSAAPVKALPDGAYTLRAAWSGAPVLELPIHLAGSLAEGFEPRLEAIKAYGDKLREEAGDPNVPDYEHAVQFLTGAWKKVLDGTADKAMLASIRRTLAQYEKTTDLLSKDQSPYSGRRGDLRLAFRSEATGRLEEYRVFIPDSYRDDGAFPAVLALNHNVNKYLDQADGVVKTIANERGYVIIAPGAVGTDKPTAVYRGPGAKDLAQLVRLVLDRYPGIDRTRLYGTGTSLGGFGTYSFATRHPNLFAAIACSSGVGNWTRRNGEWTLVERYAPVPTLILHGEIDNLVPAEMARRIAKELTARKIPNELHVFPSYGHSYENYAREYLTMTLDYFDQHTKSTPGVLDSTPPAPPAAEPVPAPKDPEVSAQKPVTPAEPTKAAPKELAEGDEDVPAAPLAAPSAEPAVQPRPAQ